MIKSEWDIMLNPRVEIINIQLCKIFECISIIQDVIIDTKQSCVEINDLLDQLVQLCQMHFMYEEKLLEDLNFPSIAEQKYLHDLFLNTIYQLKTNNDHCHSPSFFNDFIKLRLDFVSNMNKETIMLCDFIMNNSSDDITVTSH